ncbi:MAG TPA: 23S rRNA (adenine(1618)-N(6))-methyltransferase RlmF [Pyrinomonadaceae bacterium]|nr:23S rRNA (adenine(1618)-N(6))-methyltransferase RlmF [Pyrinomonadaceae bacterium]
MRPEKREHPAEKSKLHPRNRNRTRYNFGELIAVSPELANFAAPNIYGDDSIDFANPEAVKILNRALLKLHYDIENWDIPPTYLCPPIPGRADYIHHIADLLAKSNSGKIPQGKSITCLDIGVGANCVYPIIGTKEYGWSFIGADVDPVSIASAQKIVDENPRLRGLVALRLQQNQDNIFSGIIQPDEFIDLTICNPPFHASLEEAHAGTLRKLSNLNKKKVKTATLNFGGQNRELWVDGGETKFVGNIVHESRLFADSCFWFSTNVSKQSKLDSIYKALEFVKAKEVKTIPMGQGNKISRIVAWTFLDEKQQKIWCDLRWNRHGI